MINLEKNKKDSSAFAMEELRRREEEKKIQKKNMETTRNFLIGVSAAYEQSQSNEVSSHSGDRPTFHFEKIGGFYRY